jgi:excisionase family DNA binding protein
MSTAIQPNAFYTPEETAEVLRVSIEAVMQLLESGQAPAVRIGEQWRVLGASLLNLVVPQGESESELVATWQAASQRSLRELWDNDEDAVYDHL